MLEDKSNIEKQVQTIFPRVIGIDEVNVCSYFGEVVVVGVILPKKIGVEVCDSKLLREHEIEKCAKRLIENVEYFIDYVSPKQCDKSLLKYEYGAIKRICIKAKPDFVFVDFHSIPNRFHIPQWGYKGGDSELWCVAAASIIAKYTWNELCKQYHLTYPEYNLIGNKGSFGNQLFDLTKEHGLTKFHRHNWIKSACGKKSIDFNTIKIL